MKVGIVEKLVAIMSVATVHPKEDEWGDRRPEAWSQDDLDVACRRRAKGQAIWLQRRGISAFDQLRLEWCACGWPVCQSTIQRSFDSSTGSAIRIAPISSKGSRRFAVPPWSTMRPSMTRSTFTPVIASFFPVGLIPSHTP